MRRPWLALAAVLLAAVLALAGCTRPSEKPTGQSAPPPSAAAPTTESPLAETPVTETSAASLEKGPEAASLFPAADWELTFEIWDAGAAKAKRPVEQWLREDDRLVMASDGQPYATWLFDASGVWRLDPKGGGALLRYLPPTLTEGETWRQKSGEAEVWFSLTRNRGLCPVSDGRSLSSELCWTLTVLNRGELTTFHFAPNLGPTMVKAVNYAQPDGSFFKEVTANQAGRLTDADRKSLLDGTPTLSAPKATVTLATAADFSAARQSLPGIATAAADLDGDGQDETLRGQLGSWTTADIEILDKEGNLLAASHAWRGQEQRVSLIRFRGAHQPFALVEHRGGGDFPTMTIARLAHSDNRWWVEGSHGWDVKSPGTAASRVTVAEDGLVTVEWEMGDPARHTRVRQYRFDPVRFQAKRETESFRPAGQELIYPADPLEVLQAAFVTRWFNLSDELPRYFANQESAAAFQTQTGISPPNYQPGLVRFASVTDEKPNCDLGSEPAILESDGTAPFIATWGGYEWMAGVWGKVTFSKDAQGRPVIEQLELEGACEAGI